MRKNLGVPLVAFTATADAETREEIVKKLFDGTTPSSFLHGFDRPNLHLAFSAKDNPRKQILKFAKDRKGQSGIVYCGTRAKTETLSKALSEAGHLTCHYHGGMDAEDRRFVEARFQSEDGLIVVATIAFGMGVDKPDIRWVAHADLPKSIEAYYQEIGRSGRDGVPAETLTLFGADDIRLRRSQIDESLAPEDRKIADHVRLNALLGLAEARICRRVTLLNYFGDSAVECNNCDLCDNPPELFDGTEAVRKALSAILRTGEWFGTNHLIDILRGNETDKVREREHQGLPTFGVGKDIGRAQWQVIFRQMMGYDLIRPDPLRHGGLRLTEKARPLLNGTMEIKLRKDSISKVNDSRSTIKLLVSDEDAPLLSALKAKRRALAEQQKVPAYIVFNDKTLIEMAECRPKNLDDMAVLSGIGAKKLERYGLAFLSVITGQKENVHPSRRKIAGRPEAEVFDQLLKAQQTLERGPLKVDKPLSCSRKTLTNIAKIRPANLNELSQIPGMTNAQIERFGSAFIEILQLL